MRTSLVALVALVALVLVFAACGGSPKPAPADDPGGAAAATPGVAEPVAPAGPAATEPATSTCQVLCRQIWICAEARSKAASEDQRQEFMDGCLSDCAQEQPANLESAGRCLAEADGDCESLFACIKEAS